MCAYCVGYFACRNCINIQHLIQLWYFDSNCTEVWFYDENEKKAVLFQVMAWRRTGGKPLFDPTMNHLTDSYMRLPL